MDEKPCPFCGETIKVVARKCKHCGEWLEGDPATRKVTPSGSLPLLQEALQSKYEIIVDLRAYAKRYTDQRMEIHWNTFRIRRLPNGDIMTGFYKDYSIHRVSDGSLQTFYIYSTIVVDKDHMFKKVYDEIIRRN